MNSWASMPGKERVMFEPQLRKSAVTKKIEFQMHGRIDVLSLKKGQLYSTGNVLSDGTVSVYERGLMWIRIPAKYFAAPN